MPSFLLGLTYDAERVAKAHQTTASLRTIQRGSDPWAVYSRSSRPARRRSIGCGTLSLVILALRGPLGRPSANVLDF
jgi:hypothetical protein